MSEFKKGDRVRVAYEGVVKDVGDAYLGVDVEGRYRALRAAEVTLVERAKPTLKSGDVVRVGDGTYLIGYEKTAYTNDNSEVVAGPTVEELAGRIARHPKLYKINGEVFA